MKCGRGLQTFWRNILPPSSRSKRRPSKQTLFHAYSAYYSALKNIEATGSSETAANSTKLHGVAIHNIIFFIVTATIALNLKINSLSIILSQNDIPP
jgi:hypothetical protein